MENLGKYRCQLCCSLVSDQHFREIKYADRDILDVLLLRLNFDDGSKQILCHACSLKVTEAYIFKSKCLSTNNIIIPYVDNESGCSVDLREIYAKEIENKQLIDTSEGHKVCRLCMQLVRDEFTTINDMKVDMIKRYIPEINFNAVHDPVVCRQCFDSFNAHSNFLKNCLEMLEEIKNTHHTEVSASWVKTQLPCSWIKTEEVEIKHERGEHKDELLDVYPITPKLEDKDTPNKTEYMEIKTEDEDNESDVPLYNSYDDCMNECKAEDVKTTKNSVYELEYGLHANELKLRDSSLNTEYKHNLGNYKVKYNDHRVSYKQIQEKTSDVRIYKCHMCDYKAKYKCYIARHHLIHLDPSEVEMYTCDTCNFRTKHKSYLIRHQRIHKDPSQVRMHHCGICDFTTKDKCNLVKHQLLHKDPSEVQMYKCDICDFRTKYKTNIINHQLVHKPLSEVQMYECDLCHFKCKRKSNLKHHQVRNHFSETPVYKCDVCDYENKSKSHLLFHQQKHKDPSQVQMYKCNTCDYATKYKSVLVRHQRVHRNLHLMQMYKCDLCSYETEYKRCLNAHQCKLKNPLKWNQEVIEKINKSILSL